MLNIYELARSSLYFNKFEIGDLLFVEYTCPIKEESLGVWTPRDYLIHVLKGRKTWQTPQGIWELKEGQTLFLKKGAAIIRQYFDADYCMIGFFISDEFIRSVVKEISGLIQIKPSTDIDSSSIIEVNHDVVLSAFFQSMVTYFSSQQKPADSLLTLKLKELIINVLSSPHNPNLAAYFQSLACSDKPALREIMEKNFCYNLTLEEFARLCHRSLSSFKREFMECFGASPGRWLQQKRLDYSSVLLMNSHKSISQIVFECGFENLSHYSKVFKKKFGLSPQGFRQAAGHNSQPILP